MWYLIDQCGKIINITQDKIMTVGRRNADLLLENDNSISKSHAKILVIKSDDSDNINELTCVIMDAGSKYGSFVIKKNDELYRISTAGYHAKPMDKIRFGLQQHIFTVSYTLSHKYSVLISRIYGNERDELAQILEKIDGVLCDEWNPKCTHVTCSTVKLTEKVVCALVTGLYIVTKEYWYAIAIKKEQENENSLPKPEDYTPNIDSSLLVTEKISLLPNPQRKLLFNNKIFIFFEKEQHSLFSRMINLAGGSSVIHDETWKPQDCCKDNVIVIQTLESSQISQSPSLECRSIYFRLSQEKLRRVPDSEIPLAILYCSTRQYCNPKFKYDNLLRSKVRNSEPGTSSSTILVPETQQSMFAPPKNQIKQEIVPESTPIDTQISSRLQSQMSLNTNKKTTTTSSMSDTTKKNVIIPESAPIDTQISIKMQSQLTLNARKQTLTNVSQSKVNEKNMIIPESIPINSQTQTQITSITREQNLKTSKKQQVNNGKKISNKIRVMEVETVVPPIFSSRQANNRRNINVKKNTVPELNNTIDELSNDEFSDDDNDELVHQSPQKSQMSRINRSSSRNTTTKRTMNMISPEVPNIQCSDNNNTLVKRRKINHDNKSNGSPLVNEDVYESDSRESNTAETEMNSTSPENTDQSHVGILNANFNSSISAGSHFFSRTHLQKPKCIIPTKRLTRDDMYEWKPNK